MYERRHDCFAFCRPTFDVTLRHDRVLFFYAFYFLREIDLWGLRHEAYLFVCFLLEIGSRLDLVLVFTYLDQVMIPRIAICLVVLVLLGRRSSKQSS